MRLFRPLGPTSWESEEDDLEEEEEDDLCLLLFLDLCFLLGWSLLELCLVWYVCLLTDLQVLQGSSITILGLDILLKSGSRGNNTLLSFLQYLGSEAHLKINAQNPKLSA